MSADLQDSPFQLSGGTLRTSRRTIGRIDRGIGWPVDALRRNSQLDNTLTVSVARVFARQIVKWLWS
ncbi:MAG: hypothetical protein EOO21_00785 [Comamonadaceae bacterium]|nr:MAG: hypothetical protein EOO21_00785 [Comamonadaceae bacterium]